MCLFCRSVSWIEFLRDRAIYIIAERPWLRASPSEQTLMRKGSARSSLTSSAMSTHILSHFAGKSSSRVSGEAHPRSVPTTPVSKLPPDIHPTSLRHLESEFGLGTKSVPTTPLSKNPPSAGQSGSRTPLPGQLGFKSVPTTPVLKSSQGFPLLPPPPSSARASSHHHHPHLAARGTSSVPTTPTKQPLPDFLSQGITCSAQLSDGPPAGSRISAGSEGSAGSRASAGCDVAAFSKGRRSSGQNEIPGGLRRSSQSDSSGMVSQAGPLAGKPPIGGRAVAAPPYGKLVERLQSGDWRQKQAHSMLMTSDSPGGAPQSTPTFGYVTSDQHNLTGRRPLSLV